MSKTLQTRPSQIYFIHDEVTAWCFDRAVMAFGTAVDADVDEAIHKSKNTNAAKANAQRTLRKWLSKKGDTRGMFRDPAAGR